MKYLVTDIRRLAGKKSLLLLYLLAPLVVMLIFASVIAPMLFTGKGLHFRLAIFQEDNSLEINAFIFQLVHSQALDDLVSLIPVDSLAEGQELLNQQDVSVLLHVPAHVLEDIRSQKPVKVTVFSTPEHALEQSLISMTLGQSLLLVGQGQNQLEAAKQFIQTKGIAQQDADVFLRNMTYEALAEYMTRRKILGENGTLSPLAEYLPVEYYLAAIFALFAAFAMLPLIHFSASDLSGSILRRGLACGRGAIWFYLSRLLSGTLFILLVLLMVFPTSLLLDLADLLIGSAYQGSLLALLLTIVMASLCFSALAAALAAWIGKVQPALWTGFYVALLMAAAGGALIPDSALPGWLSAAGRFLPLRPAMRGMASALFSFDPALFWPDMAKLAGMAAILLPLGLWGFLRKERGR